MSSDVHTMRVDNVLKTCYDYKWLQTWNEIGGSDAVILDIDPGYTAFYFIHHL